MSLKTLFNARSALILAALLLTLVAAVSFSGCIDNTPVVKAGDNVKVDYTLTVDGTVRDSSYTRGVPLEFTVGAGQMIQGFDEAVVGMKVGEKKSVAVPPEKGYGVRDDSAVIIEKQDDIAASLGNVPEVGDQLYSMIDGSIVVGTVTDVSNGNVTIDFNHELAGKTLNFDIELVEIVTPTPASEDTVSNASGYI